MAVYKRSYHGYEGPYTPSWSRFLVISHYSMRRRLSLWFLLPFLVTALLIYFNHNTSLLSLLRAQRSPFEIGATFFKNFLNLEVSLAFILTAFLGPGLISPDLSNNGLVMYLCRPLTRTEYLLGKIYVLARELSLITWIPGLALFAIEANLSGWRWMMDHLYIAGAILLASWICILVLSLLALALSAWVKWRPVAGGLVLGVLFVSAGFGAAVKAVMRTDLGDLISLPKLLSNLMNALFRLEPASEISPWLSCLALLGFAAAFLFLLSRKLKAYEVVR